MTSFLGTVETGLVKLVVVSVDNIVEVYLEDNHFEATVSESHQGQIVVRKQRSKFGSNDKRVCGKDLFCIYEG